MVGGYFICYRRDDASDITGRLYDRLSAKFGRARVFKDVFSIELGRDFDVVIDEALDRTDALLVVIGDRWNVQRLAADADPVRRELERALARSVRIIPLFVRGVSMPAADTLPSSIEALARFNGMALRDDPDFDNDVERLIRSLIPRRTRLTRLMAGALIIALAALVVGAAFKYAPSHTDMQPHLDAPAHIDAPTPTMPEQAAKHLAKRFAAPFCVIDEAGRLEQCAFTTSDACVLATQKQNHRHCIARPDPIFCPGTDAVDIASAFQLACYARAKQCGSSCLPLELGPASYALTSQVPPSDDELAVIRHTTTGAACVIHAADHAIAYCGVRSFDACADALHAYPAGTHTCAPRPTTLWCSPGVLSSDGKRILSCFETEAYCKAAAVAGAVCRSVTLEPNANTRASPSADPRVRVSATIPRNDFDRLKGPYCVNLPDIDFTKHPVAYGDLQGSCFGTAEQCTAELANNRAGAVCRLTKGFWCYWAYTREKGSELAGPHYCSTSKVDCEGRRPDSLASVGRDGYVAISDRCYFMAFGSL